MSTDELRHRVDATVRRWNVTVEKKSETESSILAFGTWRAQPVVLKVVKRQGDEWHSGEVLQAFRGKGVVRVYECVPGAVLLERAMPGDSLVSIAMSGRDDEATAILADLIQRMSGCAPPARCPTVQDWAKGFDRYLESHNDQIPRELVLHGHELFVQLAASQEATTLLHGDLHHYNVLSDAKRGWLAIDPKGVVGEVEYEIGAVFRNPFEAPDLFTSPKTVESRVQRFARTLGVHDERVLRWAFAQAVLSAIWAIEDGFAVDAQSPALTLTKTLQTVLS
jgi:streptomycin 6-kinase